MELFSILKLVADQNRADRALHLCTLCNKFDEEDGYHFVFSCPVFSQIRPFYTANAKLSQNYVKKLRKICV